jgi:uncharacterized protein (DUF58 family)
MMNRQKEVKMMLGLIITTLEKSVNALGVLLLLSMVIVVFFGSIMYALESGRYVVSADFPEGQWIRHSYSIENGEVVYTATPFNSIGISMYFVITTLTTGTICVLYCGN